MIGAGGASWCSTGRRGFCAGTSGSSCITRRGRRSNTKSGGRWSARRGTGSSRSGGSSGPRRSGRGSFTPSIVEALSVDGHPPVSCMCLTYGRPGILEEAIQSFLLQDYPGEKELIVLNDLAEQELACTARQVTVVNVPRRFRT